MLKNLKSRCQNIWIEFCLLYYSLRLVSLTALIGYLSTSWENIQEIYDTTMPLPCAVFSLGFLGVITTLLVVDILQFYSLPKWGK
jgi:hypothetical protein